MSRLAATLPLLLSLLVLPNAQAAEPGTPGYHVLKKIEIGGDGGWDYLNLDSVTRRLYIARSNRVMVVDVDQGKLVGEVPETKGVPLEQIQRQLGIE